MLDIRANDEDFPISLDPELFSPVYRFPIRFVETRSMKLIPCFCFPTITNLVGGPPFAYWTLDLRVDVNRTNSFLLADYLDLIA